MRKAIRFVDSMIDKILVFVFALCMLIGIYFIYDTAYVFYHASSDRVTYYRPDSEPDMTEQQGTRQFTKDYVAWLHLDNTTIDYPVMQGETNSKYLNMDPYGDYSLAGSIFLDSRNAKDFSDSYCLLYGHHMAEGLMFGALDHYLDRTFFEQHQSGTLILADRQYLLDVFAVLQTEASVKALFDPNGSEEVLQLAKTESEFYREPSGTHIIALSTCRDANSLARTVVLAVMTKTEEPIS